MVLHSNMLFHQFMHASGALLVFPKLMCRYARSAGIIEQLYTIKSVSSGFVEVRMHLVVDLYSGRLIFGGSFGLTGDLFMQKIHHLISNQRDR